MKLGITTIQKDRSPWLKEWIMFHYLVGFRKFYFFAHNCTDNSLRILKKIGKKIDIEVISVNSELDFPQLNAFQYSCDHFLSEVDWMAFIDADEFLFPTNSNNLEKPLSKYNDRNISALGVYWKCFGGSNYIDEPKGLIIENYRYRANDDFINNKHIKSIVKGKQRAPVKVGNNSHLFVTKFGTSDEKLRPITNGFSDYKPSYEKFQINHYVCQSRNYFLNSKKYSGAADGVKNHIRSESWWLEHDQNEVYDDSMDKFIKPLKRELEKI